MNYQLHLKVAEKAALEAGKILSYNFGKKMKAAFKSGHDVTSIMDKESEKLILKIISKEFPGHSIFSEETGTIDKKSEFLWFIDPMDGTNNYSAGIPYFSVSISLLHKGSTILGLVYNPISKQLFTAEKKRGATLNGERINPSSVESLRRGVLSFIRGHGTYDGGELDKASEKIESLLKAKFRRTITMWAPALDWCLLAAGGIDAIVSFESELEDQYAGTLIAQEAGVKVTSFNGRPYNHKVRRIIAANSKLSETLVKILSGFEK